MKMIFGQAGIVGPYAEERGYDCAGAATNPEGRNMMVGVAVPDAEDIDLAARDILLAGKARTVAEQGWPPGDSIAYVLTQASGGSSQTVQEVLAAAGLPFLWVSITGVTVRTLVWSDDSRRLRRALKEVRRQGKADVKVVFPEAPSAAAGP